MHAANRALTIVLLAGFSGGRFLSAQGAPSAQASAPTTPKAQLPLAVSVQQLYAPQRYIVNVTNSGEAPVAAYVLTYYSKGRVLDHYVDYRLKGEPPLKPGESRNSGLEFTLMVDVKIPEPRALWFEGGKAAGDPKLLTGLRSGRDEQVHVYDAMSEDIRKLAASGANTQSILATLQSTPDKYASRQSGSEAYASTRGVLAYKTVLELLKKQQAAPATTILDAIGTLKTGLLAEGMPEASAVAMAPPQPAAPKSQGASSPASHEPTVSPAAASALLKERAVAQYTGVMRAARMQGTVKLHIRVSGTGDVVDAQVVSSPNGLLSASALDAVRRWKYNPYLVGSTPSTFQTEVEVAFHM